MALSTAVRRAAVLAVATVLTCCLPAPFLAPSPLVAAASPADPASSPAASEERIPVYVDGLAVDFDVPPAVVNDRTLVPFRLLAEALGCQVDWDQATRKVHAASPFYGRTVDLWIDQTEAQVSGRYRSLDVPPTVIGGRTLVPLRFFGEALGAEVVWHDDTRTITITSPPRPMQVLGYYALGNAETSSWTELFGRPYPDTGVGATDLVSKVACAWYVLDPASGAIVLDDSYSGQKLPDNWQEVLDRCAGNAVDADMMVHWARAPGGVTDPAVYTFLRDPAATRRAVDEIASYAADFRGVNLDVEGLGQRQTGDELAATRRDFVAFVSLLADVLHERGKTLTLSLHPLNSWYPGYDWRALGGLADWLVIMAYGYAPKGAPEPIEKVSEAVDLALEVVPGEKLLLGLLAIRNPDGSYAGETAETLAVKVGLAKRRGLAGLSLWRLGVWGAERLGAVRALVTRPPAFEVLRDDSPGGPQPIDTMDAPPLKVAGVWYAPLLPLTDYLGLPCIWEETTAAPGMATIDFGSPRYLVNVYFTPEDRALYSQLPEEGIIVRGRPYLRADSAAALLAWTHPPDGRFAGAYTTWDPNGPSGPRLLVSPYPGMS